MSYSFSLDDMITPLSVSEARESIYSVMAQVGVTTTNWKPGAVVRTLVTGCAILVAALSLLIAAVARSGFLEYAAGRWLTLVAFHVYGVDRIAATFASGEVTLDNTGGGLYVVAAGDLVVYNPTTGKAYTNTAAFTLNPLETGKIVAVRALEAGADSTSYAGEITALQTVLLGVTCTNAAAVVGADEETDPALRARCRAKLGSLSSQGPKGIFDFWARTATRADGTAIGVNRTRVTGDNGTGNVTVVVATPTGSVSGTANDPNTDLGAIHDTLERKAATLNDTLTTQSASAVSVDVTYELWMYNQSGRTEAEIEAAIEAALSAYLSDPDSSPIGGNVIGVASGKIFQDAIRSVILNVSDSSGRRLGVFHVTLTLPAADVALVSTEVATLGTVTATAIHQEALPGGS